MRRARVYWVLVVRLNLVVGFAGQIAIGWVALLTLARLHHDGVLVADRQRNCRLISRCRAGVVGARIFGLIVGCRACGCAPSISRSQRSASPPSSPRWRWRAERDRGGVGVAGPSSRTVLLAMGLLLFLFRPCAICTWMNGRMWRPPLRPGAHRDRDAEGRGEASGISKPAFWGKCFCSAAPLPRLPAAVRLLQSYIHADRVHDRPVVLFFISILIGGRGSILVPVRHHSM